MECNNRDTVHDNQIINETKDGIRVICKTCKKINILRTDLSGRFNNRKYSEVYKRDTVQPGSNLYYKINQDKMSIV